MLQTLKINGKNYRFFDLLEIPTRELFVHLISSDDNESGFWSSYEKKLYNEQVKGHEGRSEKPYRHRIGLDVEGISTKAVDIIAPGHRCDNFEVKETFIYKKNETYKRGPRQGERIITPSDFSVNKAGVLVWNGIFEQVIRTHNKSDLPEEMWKKMHSGEMCLSLINSLNKELVRYITKKLDPSNTMNSYNGLVCGSPDGFLEILKNEYSYAFDFVGISRGKPKYRLSKSYIAMRLWEAFSNSKKHEQLTFEFDVSTHY